MEAWIYAMDPERLNAPFDRWGAPFDAWDSAVAHGKRMHNAYPWLAFTVASDDHVGMVCFPPGDYDAFGE